MENKLDKLRKLLELSQNDTITPSQVKQFLEMVLGFIKKSKDEFQNLSTENLQTIKESIVYIEENYSKWENTQDAKINAATGQMEANTALLKGLIAKVKTKKPRDGVDGHNPDPEEVVPLVLAKLPPPEKQKELEPEEIARKLEEIPSNKDPKKDKRLDKKAIKGLEKLVDQDNLDRAVSILDNRTSFLINKINNLPPSTGSTSLTAGTGILVTGTGTAGDPYVVSEYSAPTISLSLSPSAGAKEIGSTITSTTMNAITVQGSSTLTSVTFFRDAVLIDTQTPPANPTGGAESYTDTVDVTTTTAFTAKITDGTTTVTSNTSTYTFVYPYLYGVSAPALAFGSMYATLTHLIQAEGDKTVSFSPSSQVMYFGYPASYADLTSILDPNGFENISSWTKRTGNITGLDGNPVSYTIYEFNNLTTLSAANFQFI